MLTWVAGAWGVFAGIVLSLATTFFSETDVWRLPEVVTVGSLLAALVLPLIIVITARLAQSGWSGIATWSGWIIGTVTFGTKTHSGSLLLLGDTAGSTVLYAGALLGAVAVGMAGTRTRARPSALKRPALPVAPVDDDDAQGEQGVAHSI